MQFVVNMFETQERRWHDSSESLKAYGHHTQGKQMFLFESKGRKKHDVPVKHSQAEGNFLLQKGHLFVLFRISLD
jgi:hypothetical protein